MKNAETLLFTWENAVLDAQIPPTAKLLLLTLRTYCRPGKPQCWPSVSTLSARTGLSRRTIQRTLRFLTHTRWLKISQKDSQGINHDSHTYTLRRPGRGRHHDAPPRVTVTPKEGIGREKQEDPQLSCQLTPKTKTNTDPEPIQDILEGLKVAESSPPYPIPTATLLDKALALENDPETARPFWIRRLYDLQKAGLTAHAHTILDYATSCADPHQRTTKDLGPMANPAAWANAKTRELLKI